MTKTGQVDKATGKVTDENSGEVPALSHEKTAGGKPIVLLLISAKQPRQLSVKPNIRHTVLAPSPIHDSVN
jgi:hypothetical protein